MNRITRFALKGGIAVFALIVVIAGYLYLRIEPPLLLQAFQPEPNLYLDQAYWFGSVPSFLYTLAVGLLLGLFSPSPRSAQRHCLAWTGLAVGLEVTQHSAIASFFAGVVSGSLPASIAEIVLPYWSRGAFDWFDLVATAAGGLFALAILHRFPDGSEVEHG